MRIVSAYIPIRGHGHVSGLLWTAFVMTCIRAEWMSSKYPFLVVFFTKYGFQSGSLLVNLSQILQILLILPVLSMWIVFVGFETN